MEFRDLTPLTDAGNPYGVHGTDIEFRYYKQPGPHQRNLDPIPVYLANRPPNSTESNPYNRQSIDSCAKIKSIKVTKIDREVANPAGHVRLCTCNRRWPPIPIGSGKIRSKQFKVGDHVKIWKHGDKIFADARIASVDTTNGLHYQVDFADGKKALVSASEVVQD